MSETNKPGIPFWIVGIVALLWMSMGCFQYIAQAFDLEMATEGLNADQIAMLDALPPWNTALFAIAVFVGLAAAITFLMRKNISVNLFVISFLAGAICQIYWVFGTDAMTVFSDQPMNPYIMPALVVVLGIFFVWYSKKEKAAGVLS
jgi:hypothetical protein